MQNIVNDLKFAARQLRRSPGFALTAILTLALGIGANTAIFSLLDQALLRALPVHDPASLVVFRDSSDTWSGSITMSGGDQADYFSWPQYTTIRDQAKDFENVLATVSTQVGLTRNNQSQFVQSELVSGNYFQTLGVPAALGRTFVASDDTTLGGNPVVVVSYPYWQFKLGADPAAIGSNVTINGKPFQIIGVSAPGFKSAIWGQSTDIFLPISMLEQAIPQAAANSNQRLDHTAKWLSMLGRLKPGITPARAQTDTAPLWHALRVSDLALQGTKSPRYTKGYLSSNLIVAPGARGFSFNRGNLEKPFLAVMAMALLVLLIASVNVASLIMVRSAGRTREFALRAALGASSGRLISQLLLEGILIGLGGGLVGVLLAPFALRILVSHLTDSGGNTFFTPTIDSRVLFFNFAVAIAVSLLFSLLPALQSRRPNLTSTLRESTGTSAGGLLKLRRIIVCVQIGLSVILLVGAGLFIRTMQQLRAVNMGYNVSHLVTFNVDPSLAGYAPAAIPAIQQRVLDTLATVPGVQAASASDNQELAIGGNYYGINVTGFQQPPDSTLQAQNSAVTPNFLPTLGVPLVAGRGLSETDTLDHPGVAVVNEAFVKQYCNGNTSSCLARYISYSSRNPVKIDDEIVGIVRDYKHNALDAPAPATMYRSLRQAPDRSQLYFYLRTTLDPRDSINAVRLAMQQIDPTLAVNNIHTMDQQIDDSLANQRLIELLAVAFGILATLLAGVGLYGVLAYSTAQRTREIGIRMALGSTRLEVASLILKSVLSLAALGVVIAIPVAYGLSVLIRSQLFGVSAADPIILLAVVALIATVAFLSAIIPARRAASISPTVALRTE